MLPCVFSQISAGPLLRCVRAQIRKTASGKKTHVRQYARRGRTGAHLPLFLRPARDGQGVLKVLPRLL